MGAQSPPQAPSAGQSYNSGIVAYLNHLPQMLQGEQQARATYDPQRLQEQLGLQDQYGQRQYQQQLDALHQMDPEGTATRSALGQRVLGDLRSGYSIPPDMQREMTAQIRGAEAARGNTLGNGAISAEAAMGGQLMNQLYQQRLTNAGNFLSSPTPEQQAMLISPVTPDRSAAYVNPNAGAMGQQFALNNYQNQLAAYQLSGGSRSPWAGAASGAASGAMAGGQYGGGYGALAGGVIGGVSGYFSTINDKTDVESLGTSQMGFPVISFRYKDFPGKRFIGTIAEKVREIMPKAVVEAGGKLAVLYHLTDVGFHEIV